MSSHRSGDESSTVSDKKFYLRQLLEKGGSGSGNCFATRLQFLERQQCTTGQVESPGNQLGSPSPLSFLLSCQRRESVLLVLERFLGRQGACAEGTGFKGLPKEPEAPFLVLPRRKENSPLVKGRGSLGGLHVLRKPAYEMLFRASEEKKKQVSNISSCSPEFSAPTLQRLWAFAIIHLTLPR